MHYLEIAHVRIVLAQDNYAMARVVRSCESAEVGDIMVPLQLVQLPALPSKRAFSPLMRSSGSELGSVISTKNALLSFGSAFRTSGKIPGVSQGSVKSVEHGVAAEGEIVYIDVGKGQGVKPGDFLIVYRDVDVEGDALATDRQRVQTQKTPIGELVILKTEELASTALVTYSTDGILLGDVVERR
jgi:hypothetical protein